MGMNTILILVAGIVMSTIIGTQVAPSIVEGVKVKKIQVQTINNQEVIFEATKRYITMKQDVPATDFIGELIKANYIDEKVNDNGFSGTYEVNVDKALGVATITTTIVDPKAQEAFLNSFMGTSKPSCKVDDDKDGICDTNEFETKYVIPNEVMHGNALLMTGIPIQATEPDPSETKYWYDTKSGKAILKIYDKDSSSWVEVNLGSSSDELFLPSNTLSGSGKIVDFSDKIPKGAGKIFKEFEFIPSKGGALFFRGDILCDLKSGEYGEFYIKVNGTRAGHLEAVYRHADRTQYQAIFKGIVAFKANDKIELESYSILNSTTADLCQLRMVFATDVNTIYPFSYTKF